MGIRIVETTRLKSLLSQGRSKTGWRTFHGESGVIDFVIHEAKLNATYKFDCAEANIIRRATE